MTGHAWKPPTGLKVVKNEVLVRLTCTNCETARQDHVNFLSGVVTKRTYTYPDGYQQRFQGQPRPAKSAMRSVYLRMLVQG